MPPRMNSTAWYAGRKRMVMSPSPVAAAHPPSRSTYAPAPGSEMSLTRPGILCVAPLDEPLQRAAACERRA
jgi:hypothetical protein